VWLHEEPHSATSSPSGAGITQGVNCYTALGKNRHGPLLLSAWVIVHLQQYAEFSGYSSLAVLVISVRQLGGHCMTNGLRSSSVKRPFDNHKKASLTTKKQTQLGEKVPLKLTATERKLALCTTK